VIVGGWPEIPDEVDWAADVSLSFVVCLSDDRWLETNLLASPCLGPSSPHEVIAVRNAPSAADGLNLALERAKNEWVVCIHQDVFLPEGWDRVMMSQYRQAERRFGPIGVAGVYGVGKVEEIPGRPPAAERVGRVVDRDRLLDDGPELPARVATLDELLLVVRRDTPLRFDPALGFHLYGADLCLQAVERGLAVVALGAPCVHNSRSVGLSASFFPSAEVLACKWASRLPIATPCVLFDREGQVYLLGNAATDTSVADAEGGPLLPGMSQPQRNADRNPIADPRIPIPRPGDRSGAPDCRPRLFF
jgi:hypothetical protein